MRDKERESGQSADCFYTSSGRVTHNDNVLGVNRLDTSVSGRVDQVQIRRQSIMKRCREGRVWRQSVVDR